MPGVISALLNATQQIGGAVGVALLNTLYTASQTRPIAAGSTTLETHLAGYRIAFTVAAVFFAAALLVITLATHQARRPRPTSATAMTPTQLHIVIQSDGQHLTTPRRCEEA